MVLRFEKLKRYICHQLICDRPKKKIIDFLNTTTRNDIKIRELKLKYSN